MTNHEITEAKTAEAQMSRFLANSPGYVFTIRRDTAGHDSLPFVSPGIETLTGLSPESLREDISPLRALYPLEDRQRVLAAFTESAAWLVPVRIEFRIRHPVRGEFWAVTFATPERQPNGETHWHGILLDITEQKAAQRQRDLLELAIDLSGDSVLLLDENLRFIYANQLACLNLGYTRDSLLTMGPFDIDPDVNPAILQQMIDSAPLDAPRCFESRHRTADGRIYPVEICANLFLHEGKRYAMTVSRDITERKLTEATRESALAEAQRLARLRGAFMAQMSHELRTPLNSILGFTQLIQRNDSLPGEIRGWVSTIQDNGEHLLALINEVLDFARIEAGKVPLDITDICLASLLEVVVATIRVGAEKKSLAFTCTTSPDLPTFIRSDALRLRQILLNLLGNAVKFTDQGAIALRVEQPIPGRLRFEVRDTGPGIAADKFESIFEPFEQSADKQRLAEGTGLGLAISRKLAQLLGGKITVESQTGRGSAFTLELDIATDAADDISPDEAIDSETLDATRLDASELPPHEELTALLEQARLGFLRRIARRANELGITHTAFAEALGRIAKSYRSKDLINFLECCLEQPTQRSEAPR